MVLKQKRVLKHISVGLIGLLGASIIFMLASLYSVGLTPDSVAYISVARNLSDGVGFVKYDGNDLVLQPPLYPLVLASINKLFSIDPLISAGFVNALLFGLIIYISGLFLLERLKSFTMVILGCFSVMISFALIESSIMALSELLFIFLVVLFLYNFDIYQSKNKFSSLIIFSIAASLACWTRYTGVVLILAGIISIFLVGNNKIKKKFFHTSIFVCISAIPIGVWIIRNFIISGTYLGQRLPSSTTLMENIGFFYNTVLAWFLPLYFANFYIVCILLMVAVWILLGYSKSKSLIMESIKFIGPTLIFILFYSGMIVVSSTTTAYDQISNRLLSPIYIPIVFILFILSENIYRWLTNAFHPKLFKVLYIMSIVMLMLYPLKSSIHIIDVYNKLSGWGYSCTDWKKSETIKYIEEEISSKNNYTYYSNEAGAVYILTNLKTLRSPSKSFSETTQSFYFDSKQKKKWRNTENICLIWFDASKREHLFSIRELNKTVKMKELVHLKDATIYIIN